MTTVLKNTITVAALAPATPTAFPHGLVNADGNGLVPDLIQLGDPDLTFVSATVTAVTLRNDGAAPLTTSVFVERWHTFDRAIPPGITDLTPQPIVIGGSGSGGGSIAEPRTTFVFRPGDPSGPHQNVYTAFATLMAAVGTVEGTKRILFDDTFGAPDIPAGAWDFTDCILDAISTLTNVDVLDGAVITSSRTFPMFVIRRMNLKNVGNSAPISMPAGARIEIDDGCQLRSDGGVGIPLVAMVGSGTLNIGKDSGISGSVEPCFTVLVGEDLDVRLIGENSLLQANGITGAGTVTARALASSAVVNSGQSGLGGFTLSLSTITRRRYTVLATGTLTGFHNGLHRVDATAGDQTINLPPSSEGTRGQTVAGKKIDGGANNVIMNPNGGDTIVGTDRTATAQGFIEVIDNGDGTWSTGAVV